MKQIKVKPNQTLFDIALEQYGTCEAVVELLSLNPNLTNAPQAKLDIGVDYATNRDFYIDLAVAQGTMITTNPDSELKQISIVKDLNGIDITTYNNGKND